MRTDHLLDALLPQTRQRVLAATMMRPERWWYVRDLARHLGLAASTVQRELQVLTGARILDRREEGRHVYVRPNASCLLFPEIRSLVRKTVGLVDVLRKALKPLGKGVDVAFVYGSIARGQEHETSDVDLMVIGGTSPLKLSGALRGLRERLGREVNPTIYDRSDLARRIRERDHFLTSVLDEEKLYVVGTERELAEAAGQQEPR